MTDSRADKPEKDTLTVMLPLTGFTDRATANLIRTVYARQDLIAAMAQSDRIRIDTETMIRLDHEMPVSAKWIARIVAEETAQGRVSGVRLEGGEFGLTFEYETSEQARAYTDLTALIVAHVRTAQYVRSTRMTPGRNHMKYACSEWLKWLGMTPSACHEDREALLRHIPNSRTSKDDKQ